MVNYLIWLTRKGKIKKNAFPCGLVHNRQVLQTVKLMTRKELSVNKAQYKNCIEIYFTHIKIQSVFKIDIQIVSLYRTKYVTKKQCASGWRSHGHTECIYGMYSIIWANIILILYNTSAY